MDALLAGLREEGFIRVIIGERLINLAEESLPLAHRPSPLTPHPYLQIVIDRLTARKRERQPLA